MSTPSISLRNWFLSLLIASFSPPDLSLSNESTSSKNENELFISHCYYIRTYNNLWILLKVVSFLLLQTIFEHAPLPFQTDKQLTKVVII